MKLPDVIRWTKRNGSKPSDGIRMEVYQKTNPRLAVVDVLLLLLVLHVNGQILEKPWRHGRKIQMCNASRHSLLEPNLPVLLDGWCHKDHRSAEQPSH